MNNVANSSSEAGIQAIDHIEVPIHECPNQATSKPNYRAGVGAGRKDCPKRFRELLQEKFVPAGADPSAPRLKKDEADSYKCLIVSLESVPNEFSRSPDTVHVAVHAALLAAFVAVVVAARSVPDVHGKWFLHLRVHRWLALMMVAVSGLPCIRLLTLVVSEPIVWFRKTHKYVVYFARGIKRTIDVTLWFLLVLGVWYTWFRPDIVKDTRGAKTLGIPVPQYEQALKMATKQVTRLLMAVTLGAFLWTLKTAMYLKLHAKLHYKELCPMVRQTILDFHAIQFITHEKGINWSFLKDEELDDQETKVFLEDVSKIKKGSAPIWILKNLWFKYMEHMKWKKPEILSDLDPTYDDDKFMEKANDLYNTFESNERNTRDITEFVFKLFASKGQQQSIDNKDQFLRWAVKALKGCLTLERIITSSKRVYMKLNMLMSSCVVVLTIVIWLLISELVTTAQLAILFAPVVSASFIIGESLKRTYDGLIFVFGMHPFDVDQRVIVGNVKMRVSELRLLTTVFFEYQTGNEIIHPNSYLSTISITKLDITENMPDSVEFTIPVDTPEELISDLGVKIKKSLDDELAFASDTMVYKKEISETNITLIVHFKYLVAYHLAEIKARHRTKILESIVRFREEMKRDKEMENAVDKEKERYEDNNIVTTFEVASTKILKDIEELKKGLTKILQGCRSSKDCSEVLLSGIEKKKITIAVHIRFRKDLLKPGDEEELKQKIQHMIDNWHTEPSAYFQVYYIFPVSFSPVSHFYYTL